MKFCQNCGAQMPDEGIFCANCGTKVSDTTSAQPVNPDPTQQPVYNNNPQQPVYNNDPQQPVYNNAPQQPMYNYAPQQTMVKQPRQPLSKKTKKIIIGVVIALVLVIIASIITTLYIRNNKETIDIMEYVTVDFTGYNTIGTAAVDFDEDAFLEAVMEAHGKDTYDEDDMDLDDYSDWEDLMNSASDYYDDMEELYELTDCIEFTVTPNTDLSNDDVVTVSVTFDEDVASDNDIILKGDDKEFTVEGLSEITEINPFDYVEITYGGTAPDAYAYVDNESNDIFYYISITLDKSEGISVGDTITASISDESVEYALENGYKVTETSKEYVVEELDHYITSIDDFDDDILTEFNSNTEDEIKSYFGNNDSYITYEDLEYVGMYFGNINDTSSWNDKNYLYVIYKANVSSNDDDFKTTSVYLPVKFTNIMQYVDGSYNYYNYGVDGSTDLEFGWWSNVSGYTDQKDMYKELITDQTDYTCAVSGDLKDYNNSTSADDDSEEETTTGEETDESDDTSAEDSDETTASEEM